jgi:hypothetical protein
MSDKIPQYADISLTFSNITYNLSPTEVDLDTVDDIILSICKGNQYDTPILVINYTDSPTKFSIDNVNKEVTVKVLSSELGTAVGKYYVNLYITNQGERATHLKRSFDVESSVKYS